MTETTQISTLIETGIKDILRKLAEDDRRTLKGEIEWLILSEQERRQESNQLVDAPAPYTVGEPA